MLKKIEDFPGLIALLEEMFGEICSNLHIAMRDRDKEYALLVKRCGDLSGRFIEIALEGKGPLSLSAEEHGRLVEYLNLKNEMEEREQLNIYYAGHRDCVGYLSRIGLI